MRKRSKSSNGKTKAKPSKFKHALLAVLIAANAYAWTHKTDQYIFDRVLKLSGSMGSCSAEQVRTAKGHDYVLTAAHCKDIAANGGILTDEYGNHFRAEIVAEDPNSDLLLLAPIPNLKGLPIADEAYDRQEIRTFTRGKGYKAYKTEGVLIENRLIEVPVFDIENEEALKECLSMPKYVLGMDGWSPSCILATVDSMSTAFVAGGSSGGAVVDSSGAIVGVVSAGGEGYSAFVRLVDIQTFLADR